MAKPDLCDTRQGLQVRGCWDVSDSSAGGSTLGMLLVEAVVSAVA